MVKDNRLNELMKERNIKISTLSRATGISRTTITDLVKKRKSNVSIDKIEKICMALNCDFWDFFPKNSERTVKQ